MAHSSEKRWLEVSDRVSSINQRLLHLSAVNLEEFERIKEIYSFCDSDGIKFANLLFVNNKDASESNDPPDLVATPLQITMAEELWSSARMWLEMGDFMNNADVITKNRAKILRNVS